MAIQTSPALENQTIYSVFVRNHSKEGTFQKVEEDLDRIKALGTDILWLMPIQPTGKEQRKGKDGSPYAIRDYRAIEPSMGTMDDLKSLVDAAHQRGLKVIVDVVYNHTSPDSVLYKEHPEWFYKNTDGKPHSIVEEWSDIIDLNYKNPFLWDYQIETLKQYAGILDGFRCDVATRVPVSFWKKAREECAKVNPDLFWLAESCHLPFTKFIRDQGRVGESDSDLYQAFDVLYDYDTFPYLEDVFKEGKSLVPWVDSLIRQEATLPANYIKLHYLENHDTERISEFVKDFWLWTNYIGLLFMLKGMPLLYHGQEVRADHRPSIFDQDPIAWKEDQEAFDWIAHGTKLHKLFPVHAPIEYTLDDEDGILMIERGKYLGLFALRQSAKDKSIPVDLADGVYTNLFDEQKVTVQDGSIASSALPLLIEQDKA